MYEGRIYYLEHKGKKILYSDFSGLFFEDASKMLQELGEVIKKEPPGSILSLFNYEDVHFSVNMLSAFNKATPEHTKYFKASASIGIKGLVKAMFDTAIKLAKQENKVFSDKGQALDWLATK
jgi:high-affinity nickel permease